MNLRPQPVGVFPLPAGLLLLPSATESEGALSALMRGDGSAVLPDEWRFYKLALDGDLDSALSDVEYAQAVGHFTRLWISLRNARPGRPGPAATVTRAGRAAAWL
jgi:hypothetical protein